MRLNNIMHKPLKVLELLLTLFHHLHNLILKNFLPILPLLPRQFGLPIFEASIHDLRRVHLVFVSLYLMVY